MQQIMAFRSSDSKFQPGMVRYAANYDFSQQRFKVSTRNGSLCSKLCVFDEAEVHMSHGIAIYGLATALSV